MTKKDMMDFLLKKQEVDEFQFFKEMILEQTKSLPRSMVDQVLKEFVELYQTTTPAARLFKKADAVHEDEIPF